MLPIAPDTLLQQRYRILNLLEDGSLGRRYLATDSGRNDADCTIEEIIPTTQSSDALARAQEFFKREIAPLHQLQHPQLVKFWGTFEERDRIFVVLDYVTGKTYAQMLEDRRDLDRAFSETEVWQLLLQILPTLGYIHSKGTIHRQISPAQIICADRDRLPVLSDFGVFSEFADKLQAHPIGSSINGQLGYAPKEQLYSGKVYPHSDLYALAVTAIVLLTGKEPSALFVGEQMNWDWRKWTHIGDEFATILGRMLSLEPEDRYQSALEVERDLQSIEISESQPLQPIPAASNRPSTLPTVAIGGTKTASGDPEEGRSAITNLNGKSIWEKPQVFIPVGALIALLAGVGSWFGVSLLLHRQTPEPVASTPPKQIDFNNPTIPTDSVSPSSTDATSDTIQPELDRSIVKEGTIAPDTPVIYRIAAQAGQNLDIQLVPATSTNVDPAKSIASPIDPIKSSPTPSPSTTATSTNPPISVPGVTPVAATQVLMTINAPSGKPIDDRADRVVGWRGQISEAGDYTIELRPIKGLSGTSFPYKLSVTQITVTPSPVPAVTATPSPGASPSPSPSPTATIDPTATPVPIEGNGIAPIPTTSPVPIAPTNNSNSGTVSPTPSVSPSPTTRRRRRRTQVSPSPQVRERQSVVESTAETTTPTRRRRNRVDSTTETTSTTRRRRNRVNSTETTTPTRRSTRQTESTQSTPKPSSSPATEDNSSEKTPQPEPSVAIPVPAAKTGASPSPGNTNVDTE
ncbi:serine/threonine-protein kinase [Chamaesiphon sp. VAR_48_metabat_403]|uniref:serine/threonine-protein kinase n=1 Tax=Chamaesiphon sp. VAR_48_metabat_403 TaxID=2964700 RepID=UPI00286EA1D7|nr:serine/threonine-protein kinase [Chamaesiphon sp. VAR_48_metabat_403]